MRSIRSWSTGSRPSCWPPRGCSASAGSGCAGSVMPCGPSARSWSTRPCRWWRGTGSPRRPSIGSCTGSRGSRRRWSMPIPWNAGASTTTSSPATTRSRARDRRMRPPETRGGEFRSGRHPKLRHLRKFGLDGRSSPPYSMGENVLYHRRSPIPGITARKGVSLMAIRGQLRADRPADTILPEAQPDTSAQLLLLSVAGLSAGAAGIHFAVIPEHLAELPIAGYFFIAVAIAQALWAILVPRYSSRALLVAGAIGNLAIAALWLFVRLRGLPIGDEPWTPERFGLTDTISAAFEVAIALGVAGLLTRFRLPVRRLATPAVVMALLLIAITGAALLNVGMTE